VTRGSELVHCSNLAIGRGSSLSGGPLAPSDMHVSPAVGTVIS
jgi:hypothetical protein